MVETLSVPKNRQRGGVGGIPMAPESDYQFCFLSFQSRSFGTREDPLLHFVQHEIIEASKANESRARRTM